jgi:hypothetical protein
MTYVLLIYRVDANALTATEQKESLRAHRQMQSASGERLHAVARLDETPAARTVRRSHGAHEVIDGPFIESKEWLVGFYLIECDDESDAIRRAKEICTEDHHVIQVRTVPWMSKP